VMPADSFEIIFAKDAEAREYAQALLRSL